MTDVELVIERGDGAVVAHLRGQVDLQNASELRDRVAAEVENTTWALVLDLTGLTYLDSAGVRLLFELAHRLSERRQRLIVVAVPGTLPSEILRVVAFETVGVVATSSADAGRLVDDLRAREARTGPAA